MKHPLLVLAAMALLLVPAADAHCVPRPPAQYTRLLEDYNDECQVSGHATNDCSGANELMALDLQEKWDGSKDVAVFRFVLDKGTAASRTQVLTLTAPGGSKSFSIRTTDDSTFTVGSGFDAVGKAVPSGDGSRFHVEATVALSRIGAVGDTLSAFKVESQAGTQTGDVMPGGCRNTALDCPPPVGSDACYYNPTVGYRLRGSTGYMDLQAATVGELAVGRESIVQVTLVNKLDLNQGATVRIHNAHGLTARFHAPDAPSGGGYSDVLHAALAARQTQSAHLALTGVTAGSHGTLTLELTTDAGGHRTLDIPYTVVEAGPAHNTTTPPHGHSESTRPAGAAAASVLAPSILLLAALAAITRRSA